jgi:hypothetical protein
LCPNTPQKCAGQRIEVAGALGNVGLPVDHGAAVAQERDHGGVAFRHMMAQGLDAAGRSHAGGLEHVLDRHGQAVQRTERLAPRRGLVGALGVLARALLVKGDNCVDRRVDLLDAVQLKFEQFQRADLAVAQHPGEVAHGQEYRGCRLGLAHGGTLLRLAIRTVYVIVPGRGTRIRPVCGAIHRSRAETIVGAIPRRAWRQ